MKRSTPLIEADLDRVRWLLDEVSVWDESLAPGSARKVIAEYYRRQEAALVAALTPEPPPSPVPTRPMQAELTQAAVIEPVEPVAPRQPPPSPITTTVHPERSRGATAREPGLDSAQTERQGPRRPSPWEVTWKPFLSESLGWFLGAFLILSGALYLVADAWDGMTSTGQALTVFGLVEAWALGFAAWAAALSKKASTRTAAVGLRRIAALVAPLAVLTLGPALGSVSSWLALVGGTALAGVLALRAAKDLEEPEALLLTASVSLATLGLGLAPVLPPAGAWLVLVPAALAAFAFKRGPRETASRTVVALLSFTLPVAASITRLLVSGPHTRAALAAMWVACAVLASAALWLRDERNRGSLTVVAMSVYFVAFLASFLSIAPACVLIAALGVWTTGRLSSEATSGKDRRVWWLAGSYAFAYLTWQRVDQLVPAIVWTWWDAIKVSLGYAKAPMPASYASVYQAVFIAVGTLVAGWLWARSKKTSMRAHLWLRCSAIAGVAAGALAMVSVMSDARPAVVALPLLLLPLLAVGVATRRTDALAAGSVLSVFFALAAGLSVAPGWPAGLVALALALGAHALPPARSTRGLRRWFAGSALASAAVALVLAAPVAGAVALSTLVLGVVAAVLAARALHRHVLTLAWLTALIPLVHVQSPLTMGLVALIGAALLLVRGRAGSPSPRGGEGRGEGKPGAAALPVLAVMAFLAPLWSLLPVAQGVNSLFELRALVVLGIAGALAALPLRRTWWVASLAGGTLAALVVPSVALQVPHGWPWLVSAAALGLLSTRLPAKVRGWLEAPTLVGLVVALAPHLGLWPGWSTGVALGCCGALALGASIHAVRRGRTWQGALLAASALLASLTLVPQVPSAWLAPVALVVLLATPALVAWLTVPLAALLFAVAWGSVPFALLALAVVSAVLALVEENDWAWHNLLNRAPLTWAASLTSVALLLPALVVGGRSLPLTIAAVLLPLVWARATRRAELLALGVAFAAGAGPWWCAPLFAFAAGRLLQLEAVRQLFALPVASKDRRAVEELTLFVASAVVAGLSVALEPSHAVAWSAALLLMGGTLPALRLAVAVAIAAPFEPLRAPVIGVLVALGAAAHHAQAHLKRALGVRSLQYVEPVALLLAIGGAAMLAATAPGSTSLLAPALGLTTLALLGAVRATTAIRRRALTAVACLALGGTVAMLAPQWMVPVTIGAAAVLLGVPGLILVAIFGAGLDLSATVLHGAPVLAPQLFPVAMVAALGAIALRSSKVAAPAASLWRWLGREGDGPLAGSLFQGALALGALLLVHGHTEALWLAPLLVVTPRRGEAAAGLAFASLSAAVLLPSSVSVPLVGAAALGLAHAGSSFTKLRLSRAESRDVSSVWRHASWMLALLGMGLAGPHLESALMPLAWSVGAATSWLLLRGDPKAEGWAWAATGVALHVVMGFVGVVLSTGAPKVLIFPWWAAASVSLALLRQLRGGKASVLAFGSVALVELLLGTFLLGSAQPREAVLSVAVAGVLAFIAWRRVVAEDEAVSAWLGQGAVVAGALAARVLGLGAVPNLTDAWVLLGASAVFTGLAQFLAREGRGDSARALRLGTLGWPVLGAVLVPWGLWSVGATWLLGVSALAAWMAQSGSRRSGSLISALALNAAVGVAALGSGFDQLQLLLIPLGLTLLVLARVFTTELSAGAIVKLRAWGMGLMYVAVAWRPLTVTSMPALILCVVVCLAGVALGSMWRIRSYVVLGSGVVVTTVLATLVRSGLAEPRLGAVFLSLLGLGVVVVMVMITTRREELQERFAAMQRVMASWEA
ncbi:MAG: hypothetical protein Q8L48_04800 [Archangium sp.]|nr:hypothetical protein [Archangium sp.]